MKVFSNRWIVIPHPRKINLLANLSFLTCVEGRPSNINKYRRILAIKTVWIIGKNKVSWIKDLNPHIIFIICQFCADFKFHNFYSFNSLKRKHLQYHITMIVCEQLCSSYRSKIFICLPDLSLQNEGPSIHNALYETYHSCNYCYVMMYNYFLLFQQTYYLLPSIYNSILLSLK